jgi:hypothetical protein
MARTLQVHAVLRHGAGSTAQRGVGLRRVICRKHLEGAIVMHFGLQSEQHVEQGRID